MTNYSMSMTFSYIINDLDGIEVGDYVDDSEDTPVRAYLENHSILIVTLELPLASTDYYTECRQQEPLFLRLA